LRCLQIPRTTVSVESSFAQRRKILNEYRTKWTSENLENWVICHFNESLVTIKISSKKVNEESKESSEGESSDEESYEENISQS